MQGMQGGVAAVAGVAGDGAHQRLLVGRRGDGIAEAGGDALPEIAELLLSGWRTARSSETGAS